MFNNIISLFRVKKKTTTDITGVEAILALDALDQVGCVEVSPEVAQELGAFDEQAVTLDDVVDGE